MARRVFLFIAYVCRLWRLSALLLAFGFMGLGGCASTPQAYNYNQEAPGYYHEQDDNDYDGDDDDDRGGDYGSENNR